MDLQKKKTYRNPKYLVFVSTLPCCICKTYLYLNVSAEDVVAAHTEGGGMGMKGPDDKVIPLCYYHHMIVLHNMTIEEFEMIYNVKVSDIIKETWAEWELKKAV